MHQWQLNLKKNYKKIFKLILSISSMDEKNKMKNKRPTLITVLCILGFIAFVFSIIGSFLFSSFIPKLTNLSTTYSIIVSLLLLSGLILIWNMKKIGLIFYTLIFAVDYIVTISVGLGNYTLFGYLLPLIIPGIFIGLMFTKFKLMR